MGVKIEYRDIAPGAKADISELEVDCINTKIADVELLKKEDNAGKNYATLERNQWRLDGTHRGLIPKQIPYWSAMVSADTATPSDSEYYCFATPITMTRIFNNKHQASGATFIFDGENGDFCNHLNIKWYNGSELVSDLDFYPDKSTYFCQHAVELFDKVVMTFYSMNKGNRFLKLYAVDDGAIREFDETSLYSVSILEDMSLISEEIPINTLTFSLHAGDTDEFIFQKKQPFLVYHNQDLYGRFFMDSSDRTSKNTYDVTAQDYKGVLDSNMFDGDMYDNVQAGAIIADIFGGEAIDVVMDEETSKTPLSGYLRICTKREALAQVLFAACSVCDTARSNKFHIFKLRNVLKEITDDTIFTGGKVSTTNIVTSVKIQAHRYTPGSEPGEVYSGDIPKGSTRIEFSNPVCTSKGITIQAVDDESENNHGISGVSILEAHTNYCVVSSERDTMAKLSAYTYSDSTTSKTLVNPNVAQGTTSNQIEVTDATLVSPSNINMVLQNVYDFYMRNRTFETDAVITGYQCGDCVSMGTEWQGTNVGHVEQLEYDIYNKTIGKVVQRISG